MSLSNALRAAALERARRNGHTVDGVVIEPTGVIDLREMARSASRDIDHTVKLPVISAYANEDDSYVPLTETALWRRLRPAGDRGDEVEATDLGSDDHVADVAPGDGFDQLVADFDAMPPFEPVVIDLNQVEEPPSVRETNGVPPIDATLADDVGRPVAVCQHCGGFGQRDLFDRFSQTEYFSCDDCGHMWQRSAEA